MVNGSTYLKTGNPWQGVYFYKVMDAFHLYIAMCISGQLLQNSVVGGAICLLGQVLVVFLRLYSRRNSALLPHNIQARGVLVFIAAALLSAALLLLYPATRESAYFPSALVTILLLVLRQGITGVFAQKNNQKKLWRILILISIHIALTLVLAILLVPLLGEEPSREILIMIIATSFATLAYQVVENPPVEQPQFSADTDRLLGVSSYRVYNRMVANTMVALNLALLSHICFIQFEPAQTMLGHFWNLVVWLLLVGGVTLLMLQLLKQRLIQYDKPTLFIVGALMIMYAIIGTFRNWYTGIWQLVGYLLWGLGLACMFSIIISMGADMQVVLELDMPEQEYIGYEYNTQAVVEWSLTLSTFLLLLMLTVITFIVEGKVEPLLQSVAVQISMRWLIILPPIFVVVAMLYAAMQPLNQDYAKKLAHYRAQQRIGKANPALEMRLQLMLVKQTRRIAPSIVRAIIRPLMPCRVIGKENVDDKNGPVVFVCNHLEIYGPLITNLHLPFYFRSWIISNMLDKEMVAKQLESGIHILFKWAPEKVRTRLPKWFTPIVLYVLNSLDPIPVYRGNMRDVLKTLYLTADAMEYEDNILIFPENPLLDEGQYKVKGISPFYSGFTAIGSEYYKRTGNCTVFYPMYANKAKHTLTIGEGVRYNPENGRNEEKERIVNELYTWMCDIAEE